MADIEIFVRRTHKKKLPALTPHYASCVSETHGLQPVRLKHLALST